MAASDKPAARERKRRPPAQSQTPAAAPGLQRVRQTLLIVDVVESVRVMLSDEDGVIDRWLSFLNEVRTALLPKFGGRLVKSLGDGMLLAFDETPGAIACALELQRRMPTYNEGRSGETAMYLRIGAHAADVVVHELDVFGSGVNLTARLATLAGPGEVVASMAVHDALIPGFDAALFDMGDCYVKHIDEPIRAFRVTAPGEMIVAPAGLPQPRPMVPRLAVLSLRNESDEARMVKAGESLSDDLIAHMSRCPYWQVTSRLSTRALLAREMDLRELASVLKVEFAISGGVSLEGDRAIVRVELTELQTATVVWSDTLVVAVQQMMVGSNAVAPRVSSHVMKALLRREMELSHVAALPNLPSYALLLQSISLLHSLAPAHFDRAQETLTHLNDRHPRSPEVMAWMAQWHVTRIYQKWTADPARDVADARRFLEKALDSDPRHALAQTLMGHAASAVGCDPVRAEGHLRLALSSNPNEPMAWLYLSHVLACLDQTGEAVAALDQARALSPLDPMAYLYDSYAASILGAAGQYDRALEAAHRAVASNANHLSSLAILVIAQHSAGQFEQAKLSAKRYLRLRPSASVRRFLEHHPAGDRPIARREADALLEAGIPL